MKKAKKVKSKKLAIKPVKPKNLPATQHMVDHVRGELKSNITSPGLEIKAGFSAVKSEISEMIAVSHRSLAIVEEQNTKLDFVNDSHTRIYNKTEDLERRLKKIEVKKIEDQSL